jgi:hypothetical protein
VIRRQFPGRVRAISGVVVLMAGFVVVVVGGAGPASAATIPVTNVNDTGAGSLRVALTTASSNSQDDVIEVDPALAGQTILLGSGLSYGESGFNLTIHGNGVQIDGQHGNFFALTNSGTGGMTLDRLTIRNGGPTTPTTTSGGISTAGPLTITNSTITGNANANSGGGIAAFVATVGAVTITNSTISNNTATGSVGGGGGGGIDLGDNNLTVTGSTFSGNAARFGGAIAGDGAAVGGVIKVVNSTISGNSATGSGGQGGGAITNNDGSVQLVYATVVSNSAALGANVLEQGGVSSPNDTLESFASVVALPQGGGTNCAQIHPASDGHNLSDDTSCTFTATGDQQGSSFDPLLAALANNGGSTLTRLPQTGSPLIDAIPLASCQADGAAGITTDQRGLARPAGPGCDIGAVEVQPAASAPAPVVITPRFTG